MSRPLLLVIDVQREYTTDGRSFRIKSIAPSLANIEKLLSHARKHGWPIVHIQHLQSGDIFSPDSEFSKFVSGFEPAQGELMFTKGNFSCFSSPEFTKAMEAHRDQDIIVVGYGSTMCCLSTVVDGYHRGFKMFFVKDATAAKGTSLVSEEKAHEVMSDVLKSFSKVVGTQSILDRS